MLDTCDGEGLKSGSIAGLKRELRMSFSSLFNSSAPDSAPHRAAVVVPTSHGGRNLSLTTGSVPAILSYSFQGLQFLVTLLGVVEPFHHPTSLLFLVGFGFSIDNHEWSAGKEDIGGSKANLSEAVDVSDPARFAFFSVPSRPVPFRSGRKSDPGGQTG